MDGIVWKRVKPLSQSNSLKNFEEDYGIIIPDVLKELIITNNGGRPSLDIIKAADGKEVEVKALLSFNKEDKENIYNVIEYFKKEFDGKILPVATEPSGDYFCIDLTSNSIVYWEHETNVLTFIAKDFVEFLNCLYKL
ncbi:SMI1/KNR4 family protein [uncultured Clostridium sp.]|uniref:SMI1/KNR4 family protein n=1 Tax=uncultured Clostridium sp. TaxID=59620 RepID=UPI002586CD06|nr:SMI1/KNR4 family protein [uncultured Clostridium sp.]